MVRARQGRSRWKKLKVRVRLTSRSQKENTALAVFSFCIAAADENCKFGDVGMREARARELCAEGASPAKARAGSTRSERFMVRRAVRILLCLRQACGFTLRRESSCRIPVPARVYLRGKADQTKKIFIYDSICQVLYGILCAKG